MCDELNAESSFGHFHCELKFKSPLKQSSIRSMIIYSIIKFFITNMNTNERDTGNSSLEYSLLNANQAPNS